MSVFEALTFIPFGTVYLHTYINVCTPSLTVS